MRTTGSHTTVLTEDGKRFDCKFKGTLRLKGLRTTNPVAAGDFVNIDSSGPDGFVIAEIFPRNNYIIRKSINLSSEAQIIAANIDLAMLVVSSHSPRTSFGFIDRFLITCEAYHIHPIIVVNKADLLEGESLDIFKELKRIYESAGYVVMLVSAKDRVNIDALKKEIIGKTTLLSGHSGSGKSSLINALFPGLNLKTGEISDVHLKGKHTTTFAEMFQINPQTYLIDTPGIKELGLTDMVASEIRGYFPEFLKFAYKCRFANCLHKKEPSCAVRQAVEDQEIEILRYASYIGILESSELHQKRD